MPKLMKTDKALCPVQIGFLRLIGILLYAQFVAQAIHELRQRAVAPMGSTMFASANYVTLYYKRGNTPHDIFPDLGRFFYTDMKCSTSLPILPNPLDYRQFAVPVWISRSVRIPFA